MGFAITTFNPFTALWWVGLLAPMLFIPEQGIVLFSLAIVLGSLAWFMLLAGPFIVCASVVNPVVSSLGTASKWTRRGRIYGLFSVAGS